MQFFADFRGIVRGLFPKYEKGATHTMTYTKKIPVVLTVKDAVQPIKEDRPGTAITENALRQRIKDGVRPVAAGR